LEGLRILSSKPKLDCLQVFRGIAALIVLLHHGIIIMANRELGALNIIFDVGWVGVDFFFVLSGFIIFYTCYTLIGNKSKIKDYIIKRLIRIYPIYWLITIGVLLMYYIMDNGREFSVKQIINSILLLPQNEIPIVSVSWSLVYELVFYFMFGLIIFFDKKVGKIIGTIWIICILLNSFNVIDFSRTPYANVIFSNNNIEFLIGCVVAFFVLNYSLKYRVSILVIGLLLFIYSWVSVIEGNILRGSTESMLMFGISCGLIVLGTSLLDINFQPKIPKLFIILGDASFSIYLTHIYFFGILNLVFMKLDLVNPLFAFVFNVIVTLILGIVCYYLVEKPLLSFLRSKFLYNNTKRIHHQDEILRKLN
jgi:exopolysaccharide production protein ExoZ